MVLKKIRSTLAEKMKNKAILIAVLLPIALGIGASIYSITDKTFVHISALHPELYQLDSIYADARGFPNAMWAYNNPAISGYGEEREAILWNGVLGNITLWTLLFSLLEIPFVLIMWIVYTIRKRKTANTNLNRISKPPFHSGFENG